MYHDVRDLHHTNHPRRYELKSFLRVEEFEAQLDYIQRFYTVVSVAQILAMYRGAAELPSNALVMTFDDGLKDHYTEVLPRLKARSLTGAFFLPARAVLHRSVMNAHKIQFILAAAEEVVVVRKVFESLDALRRQGVTLPSNDALWSTFSRSQFPGRNRWSPEMVFVTNLLRNGLTKDLCESITAELFAKMVTVNEAGFANELYLSFDDAREMRSAGMEIGGHGYESVNLACLDEDEIENEVKRSALFLSDLFDQSSISELIFSYPNGGVNLTTKACLRRHGFAAAFTTQMQLVVDIDALELLEIPRLDAPQQLPRHDSDAVPCRWTTEAISASI